MREEPAKIEPVVVESKQPAYVPAALRRKQVVTDELAAQPVVI